MTTQPEAATKRRKMRDAYMATVRITIPLDTADPQSYPNAVTAIAKIKDGLPSGATFESEARIGKVEAA